MRSDYWDTIFFFAANVLAIAWLVVMVWYRRIEREMDRLETDCLDDEDMKLEDDDQPQHTHHSPCPPKPPAS